MAALTLTYLGYAGSWYALGMGLVSLHWLYIAKVGYQKVPNAQWGKKMLLCSIFNIMVFCTLISLDFSSETIADDYQVNALPTVVMEPHS